jgi:hypothetical protein
MIQAQRIDLRQWHYNSGIIRIGEELKKVIERRTVKHFPIKVSGGGARFYHPRVPQGYLSVAIGKKDAVALRLNSYQSLQSLLDDLFVEYLTEKYRPFSNGKEWIITSWVSQVRRLLVPWNWLVENRSPTGWVNEHQPLFRSNPTWQLRSLETYGLVENTHWGIIDTFPIRAFGVVTNDPSIGDYLLHRAAHENHWGKINAYFDMMLTDGAIPHQTVMAKDVNLEDYKFSAVFATKTLYNGITCIIEHW